ncbi:MBL fold metallo-hydrolase [Novosphingobium piscinae]|uniref:MBL fold metallo-hydrolase n=1 Tax=Novosphingobium piscinae TaxID=1507448 RepID=A0A7X1FX59_9SPHN|nr:MBL fold metallo-hydrolase [Novosphingobium piscinae]
MRAAIVPVTAFEQNCSLLWCTRTMEGVLVDPGGDLPRLRQAIEKAGITVVKLLVTHGHMDHCGMAGVFAAELGVPIEGPHPDDAFWIDQLDTAGAHYGVEGHPFVPDRWLHDGDTVQFGEVTLDVIHCPGHTPGHVVFHHAPSNLAVVGDVLFAGSIGRTDFPRGNHADLIASITEKLWPLGDETLFIPGHGGTSTFGRERQTNPFVADQRFG